jgi:hypothetical protein
MSSTNARTRMMEIDELIRFMTSLRIVIELGNIVWPEIIRIKSFHGTPKTSLRKRSFTRFFLKSVHCRAGTAVAQSIYHAEASTGPGVCNCSQYFPLSLALSISPKSSTVYSIVEYSLAVGCSAEFAPHSGTQCPRQRSGTSV